MTIETANRLYELRKKRGLSQEELAEQLGVSRQAVSKWERSEASPDTDNLIALAKIYNLSLDELIYGESSEKRKADASEESSASGNEDFHTEIGKPKSKVKFWLELPYPIICTITYLIFGFLNICGGWAHSWIIFITIPIYYSLIEAIYNRRFSEFAYPVFTAFVYLYMGLYIGNWHPSWIIFVTIPVYYPIAEALDREIKACRETTSNN